MGPFDQDSKKLLPIPYGIINTLFSILLAKDIAKGVIEFPFLPVDPRRGSLYL